MAAPTRAPVLARRMRHASRAMIWEHDFRACLEICRLPALHPTKLGYHQLASLKSFVCYVIVDDNLDLPGAERQ
jgi:hypothetical protein